MSRPNVVRFQRRRMTAEEFRDRFDNLFDAAVMDTCELESEPALEIEIAEQILASAVGLIKEATHNPDANPEVRAKVRKLARKAMRDIERSLRYRPKKSG
jgi:hypothetical protein